MVVQYYNDVNKKIIFSLFFVVQVHQKAIAGSAVDLYFRGLRELKNKKFKQEPDLYRPLPVWSNSLSFASNVCGVFAETDGVVWIDVAERMTGIEGSASTLNLFHFFCVQVGNGVAV